MPARIVVGLFESEGIAEDARNRLKTEGVPENELGLTVLSKIGPMPSTMEPEASTSRSLSRRGSHARRKPGPCAGSPGRHR